MVGPEKISPDADDRGGAGQVLCPAALGVVRYRDCAGSCARQGVANFGFSCRVVDLPLQDTRQRTDVGMHLADKQVDARDRRFRVGTHIVLIGLFQSLSDLCRGIARKPLNVPEREAAGDEEIEQHGAADHQDEFGAKRSEPEPGALFVDGAHSGFRPEAAQIGQPA
ncbi:hypothetical protein D9M68_284290 [compost metagenome]